MFWCLGGFKGPYRATRIQIRSTVCKAINLLIVLSLQPCTCLLSHRTEDSWEQSHSIEGRMLVLYMTNLSSILASRVILGTASVPSPTNKEELKDNTNWPTPQRKNLLGVALFSFGVHTISGFFSAFLSSAFTSACSTLQGAKFYSWGFRYKLFPTQRPVASKEGPSFSS